MNPYFQENSFKFDTAATFHPVEEGRKVLAHEVHQSYRERFGRPLIEFDLEKCAQARRALSDLVPDGSKFVAVHVRDSGFYNDPERSTRNGDIFNYEPAIRYLIEKGYIVVRMGDPSMIPIGNIVERCGSNLIDYAHSKIRSPLVDCYLVSNCDFFIGLASGIWALAIVFEKPTVLVNFYSAATGLGFSPDDLTTFKTLRYRSDDTLVSFERQLSPPFSHNPPVSVLEEVGVYLKENNPEDILATVKEFLARRGMTPTRVQYDAKKRLLPANFAYGGAGNFSNTVLNKYYEAKNS
jgi:putative glycosyltransferase (TIGR04372 family)